MVRCRDCIKQDKKGRYSDPYETGYRRMGYPILRGFVFPTSTRCNSCGEETQVSGWFEKDPHL